MIDRMCGEQHFASMLYANELDKAPVIGTIERRPVIGSELPARRSAASEGGPLAAEVRQRL
jgi:hypothetical protein